MCIRDSSSIAVVGRIIIEIIAITERVLGRLRSYLYCLVSLLLGVAGYILGKSNPLFAESDKHGLLFAFDMLETRDYGQQFNVGFEYSMYDMFFIRAGQRVNYDIEGLTLGFGINAAGGIRFDYSYASYGESFSPVSRFTIGYGKN